MRSWPWIFRLVDFLSELNDTHKCEIDVNDLSNPSTGKSHVHNMYMYIALFPGSRAGETEFIHAHFPGAFSHDKHFVFCCIDLHELGTF